MKRYFIYPILIFLFLYSCKNNIQTIKPRSGDLTESVYASGFIKSENQYQAFLPVAGIISEIYANEGDTLVKGQQILRISDEAQKRNRDNASLNAAFASEASNDFKLKEAAIQAELAANKYKSDSIMWWRQKKLFEQNVGSLVELEQKELLKKSSYSAWVSARTKQKELIRQIQLNQNQAGNTLAAADKLTSDYVLKSETDGILYSLIKKQGEMVNQQTPIAIIGKANSFILEMQIDEYDILKIKNGQKVFITLDSYKGKVFFAYVTKINPLMNARTKTFTIEARFKEPPPVLYPNLTFEANIEIQTRKNILLLPRQCLFNDSLVVNKNGDTLFVKLGLRDFRNVEVLSGLKAEDEIIVQTR